MATMPNGMTTGSGDVQEHDDSEVTSDFINRLGDDRNAWRSRAKRAENALLWFIAHGNRATTACPGACYNDRSEHAEYSADRWCDCCRAAAALSPPASGESQAAT